MAERRSDYDAGDIQDGARHESGAGHHDSHGGSHEEHGLDDRDASTTATDPSLDEALDLLERATSTLVTSDLDRFAEDALRAHLRRIQRTIQRLIGLRATASGLLEQRALSAAGPGRESQALRMVRQTTADDLRLPPSEVKRAGETGRRVAERPAQAAALQAGDLSADHARVLADTLRFLDPEVRDTLEAELLVAARDQDAVAFGRTCRRRLAEVDAAAASSAQDRRNTRRHLRVTQTPDGMLAVHGEGSGLSAEYVATALHAFRRPDAPGERRTSEQASWDALEQVCRVALDAGAAPTDRRARPHVLVTVDHATVVGDDGTGAGVAEAAWSGPLPWSELRRMLTDAGVARLLLDARGVPLEASEEVRTVPAGLWRLLVARDRTCIGDRCTVPAAWCQAMHLDVPYRLGGRLTPGNAGLGCSYHHRMLDHGGWVITWQEGRPVLHRPDRPPRGGDRPRPDASSGADRTRSRPDDGGPSPGDGRPGAPRGPDPG